MQKRRGRKRRKSAGGRFFRELLVILAAMLAGAGGYEYYTTGSLSKVEGIAATVSDYAGDVGQWASNAEEQLKKTLSQWQTGSASDSEATTTATLESIPEYTGESYVVVNENIPSFTKDQQSADPYEYFSELDSLGRCGYAEAKIDRDMMPTEPRGPIGMVKPSGWHTVKYDVIDQMYLYNRCHLIGYQLTGENANEKNLITGTRYFNVEGMLPWENKVAYYIEDYDGTVMYRVTPLYDGANLLASGVQMEALSLDSNEICFNIYVFNVQPGIGIDYSNGNSWKN